MMKTKDLALCLRAVNYSDTSQVVTLMTRDHGKIAAMAKGSRRPKSAFDGAIEPFAFGPVMFAASTAHDKLATLTEFVQSPRFRLLRSSLDAMHAGLFALELTEAFCHDSDPHPALFDALADALERLTACDRPASVLLVLMDYQLTLLTEAGIAPLMDACTNCGGPVQATRTELYFSSTVNGILCGGCEQVFAEKRRISSACAALLNRSVPLNQTPAVVQEAEQLLIYHFTELLHRPPKMARHFLLR